MKIAPGFWIWPISLLGTLLFWQSLTFGYTLDDGIYSYYNKLTSGGLAEWLDIFRFGSMNFIELNPTNSGIYRPFTLLTFAIEKEITGTFNPTISHSINLILYFFTLVVTGFLLLDLHKRKKSLWWIPFLTLLIYTIHPVHVEVVASVKSRDTLLSALFGFGSVLLWLKTQPDRKAIHWAGITLIYFLSLISKEESLPLIALVGLISYFILTNSALVALRSSIPFGITALLYLALRFTVLDSSDSSFNTYVNSILYATEGHDRIATNFYIYLQYLKLLFFPHPLSWDYSFGQLEVQSFANPLVWVSILVFSVLIWLAIKGITRRTWISFGLIFYFASFSIFANLTTSLTIGSNLAERFLFVPSLAFSLVMVHAIVFFAEKKLKIKPIYALVVLSPVILAFTWKSVDRTKFWKNNYTILKEDVKNSPKSWRTHTLFAEELRVMALKVRRTDQDSAQKLFEEAKIEYGNMLKILGKNMPIPQYLSSYSEILIALGDTTEALLILNQAVEKNPTAFYPLFQLGRFSFENGDFEEAEKFYLRSLKAKKPNFGPAYKNLGLTYLRKNEKEKAIQAFEKSLNYLDEEEIRRSLGFLYSEIGNLKRASFYLSSLESDNPEERIFLQAILEGNLAMEKSHYPEAVKAYSKAWKLFDQVEGKTKFPTFYSVYGKSLLEVGDTLNSKKYFLLAITEVDSRDPVVFTNLGTIAFLREKNYKAAETYYQKAVDLGPADKFDAYSNLGMAQLAQNKESQAAMSFEKALEFGESRSVIGNLFLINKALGNHEKAERFKSLLNQSVE